MTESERDAIRETVRLDNQKMKDGLAVFFLGRTCPLTQKECGGPDCPWFLTSGEQQGQRRIITGGNCSIPLIASQVGPLADGLAQLATIAATPEAPARTIIPAR